MRRTITVAEMLEELKHSDAAFVVIDGEAEDRQEAIEFLEDDLRRGVVQPDREVGVSSVVSYTFTLTMPPLPNESEGEHV